MKVAIELGHLFFNKLQSDGWLSSSPPVNDLIESCKRPNDDNRVLNLTGNENEGHYECLGVAATSKKVKVTPLNGVVGEEGHDPEINVLSTSKELPSGSLTELSVKATKSDNAKVNERQWGIWSVNNFVPAHNSTSKICVSGTYCATNHGRLFKDLQALAL